MNIFRERYLFFFFILFIIGCSEEEVDNTKIITEDILYVSGERVRLTGRVLSLSDDPTEDYGFQISLTEDFSNPVMITLGTSPSLGRFVGESDQLEPGLSYFCRAFVNSGDQIITGNILEFNTLNSFLSSFEPSIGYPSDQMTIIGGNFYDGVKVFLGSIEAQILDIDFESRITIRIPEPETGQFIVPVRVVTNEIELISDSEFNYVTGLWTKVSEVPSNDIYDETVTLFTGSQIKYGQGQNALGRLNTIFYNFDINTLQWSSENSPTVSRFPFGSSKYFGSGGISFIGGKFYSDEFWEYDNGFNSLGSTPFRLYQSIALESDNKLYVFGGETQEGDDNTNIYEYDPNLAEWSIVGETLFTIRNPLPHFELNGSFYVYNREENDILRYDLATNTWSRFIDLPDEGGRGGIAFVIDNEVYIGMFDLDDRIWRLDFDSNSWIPTLNYPESKGDPNAGFAVVDNKLFLIKNKFQNSDDETLPAEVWSFDPKQR